MQLVIGCTTQPNARRLGCDARTTEKVDHPFCLPAPTSIRTVCATSDFSSSIARRTVPRSRGLQINRRAEPLQRRRTAVSDVCVQHDNPQRQHRQKRMDQLREPFPRHRCCGNEDVEVHELFGFRWYCLSS